MLGRIRTETYPGTPQRQKQWAYLAGGVTEITDEESRKTQQTWRAFGHPKAGRLTRIKSAAGTADETVFDYEYNTLGQLTKVWMPGGASRTWTYEPGTDLLLSETHPEAGTTAYTYYNDGQLRTRTRGSETFTYAYDAAHQLKTVDVPGTDATHNLTFDYDTAGNRTLAANGHVSTSFHWDAANRLDVKTDTITDVDGAGPFVAVPPVSTLWTYDALDRLERLTYPSGLVVKYAYDGLDRLTSVKRTDQGADVDVFTVLEHHPSGAVKRARLGNGVEETFGVDERLRPTSIAGGALSLTYGYTGAGNVETIVDGRAEQSRRFGYDALDRLTSVKTEPGLVSIQGFAYDALGNRTLRTDASGTTTFAHDPATLRLMMISFVSQALFPIAGWRNRRRRWRSALRSQRPVASPPVRSAVGLQRPRCWELVGSRPACE